MCCYSKKTILNNISLDELKLLKKKVHDKNVITNRGKNIATLPFHKLSWFNRLLTKRLVFFRNSNRMVQFINALFHEVTVIFVLCVYG